MSKFAGGNQTARQVRHPIITTGETRNFEGAPAYSLGPEAELFLLAAVNMVGEDTYYEAAGARDARFAQLVHQVTQINPHWIRGKFDKYGTRQSDGFAKYLRGELKMRSASVVLACEYVRAGGPGGRKVIDAVCQRPDEPAEVLGYWMATHGRHIPQPVKRGIADAAARLYTSKNVIKWDSSRKSVSFADVIELTHPEPRDQAQSVLFKYLLDQAHHNDGDLATVTLLLQDSELLKLPEHSRRGFLRSGQLPDTWTWERLAGWLPGGMDAEAWEAIIPNMGVMALIRNLRNFDGAGISENAIQRVIDEIGDPEAVAKSRIFPYQVWSAYQNAPSDNWKRALGNTLDLATLNTPELPGRTLVLIDTSGSMQSTVSGKSQVWRAEVAAIMATAMAKRNAGRADIGIFAQGNAQVKPAPGYAALSVVQAIVNSIGKVGHSTMVNRAIADQWNGHDRVIVFTDDQAQDAADGAQLMQVPRIYTFDLGGYGRASRENGKDGRFLFGGFSDSALAAIPVIENAGHAGWPF